jgi:hypothetical protein
MGSDHRLPLDRAELLAPPGAGSAVAPEAVSVTNFGS